MKFKVLCKACDTNVIEEWTYNNNNNEIHSFDGERVVFKKSDKIFSEKKLSDTKSKTLAKLRIQVGLRCNYHCSYCKQSKFISNEKSSDWEKFIPLLNEAGISVVPTGKIEIWGGEPLVYWKILVKLIPALRERFATQTFSLITNGSLLSKPKVDFLAAHKVNLTISHDAQGFSRRDKDNLLDNPKEKEIWLYAKEKYEREGLQFGFNVVITNENSNFIKIADYFKEHFAEDASFGFEGAVIPSTPDDILRNGEELIQSLLDGLLDAERSPLLGAMLKRCNDLFEAFKDGTPINSVLAKCDVANKNSLVVDLQGRIIACHNESPMTHTIGHLKEYGKVNTEFFHPLYTREDCLKCPVVQSCHGSCPLADKAQHLFACANERIFHFAIFYAVWLFTFQRHILSITPIEERE